MENGEKPSDVEKSLRPIRVRSMRDASRLLGRALMQLQKDQISESKARTIAYVANSYVKVFEVSEMEGRIEALEQKLIEQNCK